MRAATATATGAASGPTTWEQMRDDLLAVVAHAAVARRFWSAHRWAAWSALPPKAMDAPLFRALVLVDVTPRWEPRGVDRILNFMRAHPQGFESLDAGRRGDRGVSAASWRAQVARAPARAARRSRRRTPALALGSAPARRARARQREPATAAARSRAPHPHSDAADQRRRQRRRVARNDRRIPRTGAACAARSSCRTRRI